MKIQLSVVVLLFATACGGDVSDPEPCELYCDNAMRNCTGSNQLYEDRAACESACAAMPVGSPGDQSGNSVYCRAYHSGAPAAEDPATHCPHASASSDQMVCGTLCEAYCSQIQANCTGDNASFTDMDSCLASCAAFPVGSFDDKSGDTVQCRTYHASFPAFGNPETHCPHASPSSDGDICGSVCEAYCDQAMANCTEDNELYSSREECMTACSGFADGSFNDVSGDTAQCRVYHASFPAAGDPDTHCAHAGENPTDLCL